MPGGRSTGYIGLQFGLESFNQRFAVDEAGLGQVDYVANIPFVAALQFCKRKIVRFQCPEPKFRPHRERPEQTVFVVCGIVGYPDIVDIHVMFLLQG